MCAVPFRADSFTASYTSLEKHYTSLQSPSFLSMETVQRCCGQHTANDAFPSTQKAPTDIQRVFTNLLLYGGLFATTFQTLVIETEPQSKGRAVVAESLRQMTPEGAKLHLLTLQCHIPAKTMFSTSRKNVGRKRETHKIVYHRVIMITKETTEFQT